MSKQKRPYRRLYWYEVFLLINAVVVSIIVDRHDFQILAPVLWLVLGVGSTFIVYVVFGVAGRMIAAAVRRSAKAYVQSIRNLGWASDVVRMILFSLMTFYAYGWLKLALPVLRRRLFDQELWDIDQAMFFGFSPNILFLDLFSKRFFLHVIDFCYAWIFVASLFVTFAFFLSEPSRRLRIAFITGNGWLWMIGAWLYLLIPSIGPAYRFPDVWFTHGDALGRTQYLQGLLIRNYNSVIHLKQDPSFQIHFPYGVAAFPSMHVAFQSFVFFWMRKVWKSGEVLTAIFTVTILLGSVLTGWHYLIDGLAGILLAAAVFWIVARVYRLDHAIALQQAVRRNSAR